MILGRPLDATEAERRPEGAVTCGRGGTWLRFALSGMLGEGERWCARGGGQAGWTGDLGEFVLQLPGPARMQVSRVFQSECVDWLAFLYDSSPVPVAERAERWWIHKQNKSSRLLLRNSAGLKVAPSLAPHALPRGGPFPHIAVMLSSCLSLLLPTRPDASPERQPLLGKQEKAAAPSRAAVSRESTTEKLAALRKVIREHDLDA